MVNLWVSTLGPLRILVDGERVDAFEYNKVRGLLVYLAVEAGRDHARSELCALFWPDLSEKAARRNLSQALTTLRRGLSEDSTSDRLVVADNESLRIGPAVTTDVERFMSLLAQTERHSHHSWHTCQACSALLEQALALYNGDFLTSFFIPDSAPFEEWALVWRERLRQRAFSALERLARRAEWRGAYAVGAEWTRQLVALDPLREASHRERMRLLGLAGEWTAAQVQHEQLRRILNTELGVAPEASTQSLLSSIRRGLRADLERFDPPPRRIPQPPTPLIGRARDLQSICDRLRADDARLLTVVGPPGVGKTRLALAAAEALLYDFSDGAHVIELAAVADAADVAGAIADGLTVKERPGKPVREALIEWLRARHLLLVLDNFEHVADAAPLIAEMLSSCPHVRVLATSRTPLQIRVERQAPLAPLDPPEAIDLFVARARANDPTTEFSEADRAVVAELCARLDHLPLAIELIAVRANASTPAELLRVIEPRLPALDAGSRDLPARQRTLRAAIDWSYARLDAVDQRVFAHLSVFAGPWTLEAAQAVCTSPTVADSLRNLQTASLVYATTAIGETHFTYLETIREFALEQLTAAGQWATARSRHRDHFVCWAEWGRSPESGLAPLQWFDRLERQHDNLRQALTAALEAGQGLGLRLAAALADFWAQRGHLSEGRRWLARALADDGDAAPRLRAPALLGAGALATRQGDYADARAQFDRARQLYAALGDAVGLSRTVRSLGIVADYEGDIAEARARYQESLELAEAGGDRGGVAASLSNLGLLAADADDLPSARRLYAEALFIARETDHKKVLGNTLLNLALLEDELGNASQARAYLDESLAQFRALGDPWNVALVLFNLGQVLLEAGELEQADTHFRESLRIDRELGDPVNGSYAIAGLGLLALMGGDTGGARRLLEQSLQTRHSARELRPIARNLDCLARLERLEGQPRRAARLLGAAEALRRHLGLPLKHPYIAEQQDEVAALRAELGAATFASGWAAGEALTLEQAVAYALRQPDPLSEPRRDA